MYITAFQGELAHVDQELVTKQELLQRKVSGDSVMLNITSLIPSPSHVFQRFAWNVEKHGKAWVRGYPITNGYCNVYDM